MPDKQHCTLDDFFYGSVTVGERGQIVIPADAREELGFKPGDKLIVMRHKGWDALVLTKLDHLTTFMEEFKETVNRAIEITEEPK